MGGEDNVSGRLRVLQLPRHYDFKELRLTPTQTRERLRQIRHANVVAFQTRGIYAEYRRGGIQNLSGIDDPYEPPQDPEVTLETTSNTPDENAHLIMAFLAARGFV